MLTPLAVNPSPYISGLWLTLAVVTRDPQTGRDLFARMKVPDNALALVTVSPGRPPKPESR